MWVFKVLLKKDNVVFEFLCFVIAIISAIDLYFIGKTRTIIQESEENPIGQYLLRLDNGDISLFIAAKFLGTLLALYILFKLHRAEFKYTLLITWVIAIAQTLLLIYLFI
jgi:hypothetical protein|tara:strand:+ start:48965 stop:49294 length:330 start_codon:yes stop_codon:yes gene_type:complete